MSLDRPACPYCRRQRSHLRHARQFHRLDPRHGPFDFWACPDCGAGFVHPLPSTQELAAFYARYSGGMYGELAEGIPDARWHGELAEHIQALAQAHAGDAARRQDWIEVGAGGGEIAAQLAAAWPGSRGVCTDLHARPRGLPPVLEWRQADAESLLAGQPGWRGRFGLVYCSAVLEHVRDPLALIETCLQLAAPGGLVYFMCPNHGSLARRVMGTAWPYFLVGEHLSLPSPRSIRMALMQPELRGLVKSRHVAARRLHYNLRYALASVGLKALGRWVPARWRLGLPTGILDFSLVRA